MDGTIGSSIRLASSASEAGKQVGLRDGEILSIRIEKFLGKGRYAVAVRGSLLTVRSLLPLEPGRIIRARVLISGQRVELRLLGSIASRSSAAPVSSGPPVTSIPTELTSLVAQSMRRSGLPISPESMAAISAMIPRTKRRDPSFVRFATILFDKHLHVDPELLEELYLAGTGDRDGAFGDGRRGGHWDEQRPNGNGRQHESGERTEGIGSGVEAEAAERPDSSSSPATPALREQLRAQLRGGTGREVSWWALFNHQRGEHEGWVVVPFGLKREETVLDGSIRVLLSSTVNQSTAAGLAVARAVVVVNGVGAFEIGGSPPRRLAIHAETTAMRQRLVRLLPELAEKLRNLGVEVDDTINGGKIFDGFSSDHIPMQGVDAIV